MSGLQRRVPLQARRALAPGAPLARRAPLAPGKPLERRAALPPGGRLARRAMLAPGGPLERCTPIRKRSAKTERVYVLRRQLVEKMLLYPSLCQVTYPRQCPNVATDLHEALTRARGGDILDVDVIRLVCRYHNWLFSQDEQPWMYEHGFLIHSWDAPGNTGDAA